jgi:branched-chain amino acid transport system substrate-binding protein
MKRNAWIALLVVAVAAVAIVFLSNRETRRDKVIRVGRVLPLTGPAASYGKSEQKGTWLAAEEINAAGGIQGRQLDIIFEDDQCEVKIGVNAMKKLVEVDKVPAVLGATISGITLAIAPLANEKKVLLLSPLSSVASITDAGPFVFRIMPSDAFQSRILADWVFGSGHKKIAMLYMNNAWGKGVAEEFKRAYDKLGGSIACTETCKEGDRDFRVQLTKIRDAQVDALFCPTMPKEGGVVLKQLKELAITLPVFGADAWSVAELLEESGNAAEGVKYAYPAQFTGEEYQSFAKAFKARFNEDPDVNAAGAYDAVKVLAMCMGRVLEKGLDLTGDNIRQEMNKVSGYRGATGTTTFDENGDPIAKSFDKMVIRDGQRVKSIE